MCTMHHNACNNFGECLDLKWNTSRDSVEISPGNTQKASYYLELSRNVVRWAVVRSARRFNSASADTGIMESTVKGRRSRARGRKACVDKGKG